MSDKTTPVDPMGGPRATKNVKRHSMIDEAENGELLQEQVAVTPREMGLHFDID